jgi:hypothetical protein
VREDLSNRLHKLGWANLSLVRQPSLPRTSPRAKRATATGKQVTANGPWRRWLRYRDLHFTARYSHDLQAGIEHVPDVWAGGVNVAAGLPPDRGGAGQTVLGDAGLGRSPRIDNAPASRGGEIAACKVIVGWHGARSL